MRTAEITRMLKRAIPSSGERIPAVGLGTWQTFDLEVSPNDLAPLEEVRTRFVLLGGTMIGFSRAANGGGLGTGVAEVALEVKDRFFHHAACRHSASPCGPGRAISRPR